MKTVNKLIDGFIDLQKSLGIIGENEKDTYIYAYTILFEQVLNIFIAIRSARLMGALGFVGVFLLFYIPLRILGGGYHADSGSKCCIFSAITIFLICILSKTEISIFLNDTLMWLSSLIIIVLSPVDSICKMLNEHERKTNKIRLFFVLLIEWCGILVLFTLNKKLYEATKLSLIFFTITLLLGKIKRVKRRK